MFFFALSVAEAPVVFAASSSSYGVVLGPLITGMFLLANTAITLYVTRRPQQKRRRRRKRNGAGK